MGFIRPSNWINGIVLGSIIGAYMRE